LKCVTFAKKTLLILFIKGIMTQNALLDSIEIEIRELLELVRANFVRIDASLLEKTSGPKAWNALQCFAHLNSYSDYYFPRIELAIHKGKARQWLSKQGEEMESNWIGRRAIKSADPSNIDKKRSKSSKRFNSTYIKSRGSEVKSFIINCEVMLRYIRMAREVDLNRVTIPMAQFNFLKLRLGDLLHFLTLHARRHVIQAEKTIQS
jgi:DinB superfamily